jgi:hypothetical protein
MSTHYLNGPSHVCGCWVIVIINIFARLIDIFYFIYYYYLFFCVEVSEKTANQSHWKEYGCGFKIVMAYSLFILIFFFLSSFNHVNLVIAENKKELTLNSVIFQITTNINYTCSYFNSHYSIFNIQVQNNSR